MDNTVAKLTARQSQVVNLIAYGLTNRAIAETLGISQATVRHHVESIFERLEVRNRVQAVALLLATRKEVPATLNFAGGDTA